MRRLMRPEITASMLFFAGCTPQPAASPTDAEAKEEKVARAEPPEPPAEQSAAEPAPAPPALLAETLLYQPELHWADGRATQQGTAFAATSGDRCFVVTSTHFLNFDGPALEKVALLEGAGQKSLGEAALSWGRPGNGGITDAPVIDLNEDVLLLPCRAVPGGRTPISLLEPASPAPGDVVWLPNKQGSNQRGHTPVQGIVRDVTAGWINVRFEGLEVQSQSGSPIVDQQGRLVGLFSRAVRTADGATDAYLTPALAVWRMATSAEGAFPLKNVVRDIGKGDEVSLTFDWPVGAPLLGLGRRVQGIADPEVAEFQLQAERLSEGFRITRTDASGAVAHRVTADGKFLELEDPDAVIELALKTAGIERLPPEEQEALRAKMTPELTNAAVAADWNRLVGEWAGAELRIGQVFQREDEAPNPIGEGTIQVLTILSPTQKTACSPQDADLSCVKLVAMTVYDAAQLGDAVASLVEGANEADKQTLRTRLANRQLGMSIRRYLVTRPGSLVPVHSGLETVVSLIGPDREFTLDERIYREP